MRNTAETMDEKLARMNFFSPGSVDDLVEVEMYDENYKIFMLKDGRVAKAWRIGQFDISTFSEEDYYAVSDALGHVISSFPEESCGQLIAYSHPRVSALLDEYVRDHDSDDEISKLVINSIAYRQRKALETSDGFFEDLTERNLNKALTVGEYEGHEDLRQNAFELVKKTTHTGKKPLLTDLYFTFIWTPPYLRGKSFFGGVQTALKYAFSSGQKRDSKIDDAFYGFVKLFLERIEEIESSLLDYNFCPQPFTGQGAVDVLYQLLNPLHREDEPSPTYVADMTFQSVIEKSEHRSKKIQGHVGMTQITRNKLGFDFTQGEDKYFARACSMLVKPGNSYPGMIQHALTNVAGEGLVTLNFFAYSKTAARKRLWVKMKQFGMAVAGQTGELKDRTQKKIDTIQLLMDDLDSSNPSKRQLMMDMSVHFVPMGRDKKEVEDRARRARRSLFQSGCYEEARGDAVVYQSLPFNIHPRMFITLGRGVPTTSRLVNDFAPVFREFSGYAPKSKAILVNNSEGEPIFLNPFDKSISTTGHGLVVGGTGSGKSFAVNNMVMQIRAVYDPFVWIIDKGRSYESLCLSVGGNYIDLVTEKSFDQNLGRHIYPTCINPFYTAVDDDGNRIPPSKENKFFMVYILITMMRNNGGDKKGEISEHVAPFLYECIDIFYQRFYQANQQDEATLSDVIQVIRTRKNNMVNGADIADLIRLYYGNGPYAGIFDGPLDIDWNNRFTVLETERMAKEPCMAVVMVTLMRQIDEYAKRLPKNLPKMILIDEAWSALSDDATARAVSSFYRELRKYTGACWLISQRLGDFARLVATENAGSGSAEDGIYENTSHFYLLAASATDWKLGKEEFGFSDEEVHLWRTVTGAPPFFSECCYRLRTPQNKFNTGKFRLFSAPIPLWLATSDGDDVVERDRLTTELMTSKQLPIHVARLEAVKQLAEKYPYGVRYETSN